jgi:hypothetical protein
VIFHFGEFSRIYQSFLQMNKCIQSNTIGTNAVFDFCLKNKIKLFILQLLHLLATMEKIKIYHHMLLQKQKI